MDPTKMRIYITLVVYLLGYSTPSSGALQHHELQGIVVEFFRFKRVTSIDFITCSGRMGKLSSWDWTDRLLEFITFLFASPENYQRLLLIKEMSDQGFFIRMLSSSGNLNELHLTRRLKSGILMDLDCPHSGKAINKAGDDHLFRTNKFWLLVSTDFLRIQNILATVSIPANGEVMTLVRDEVGERKDLYWNLWDIYTVAPNKPMKIGVVARKFNYPSDLHRHLQAYGLIIPKRKNLEGISIKCGLAIFFPELFTTIDDLQMRHVDTISRSSYPITSALSQDLNFSFNMIQVDNYGWTKNGTFDGLVGHLQRGSIEFSTSAILMRLERIPVVDFAAEAFKFRACIMFRQPPLSQVSNIYALPFTAGVWWSLLLFFIISGMVMITQLFHPHFKVGISYLDCIIFSWGAICQQGFFFTIYAPSGRILIFTTFITTLFLFTSFSANIVALLQSPSEAISTISDLIQSPLDIGVQITAYNKIYFKETTNPVTRNLYSKKIKPKEEDVFMQPHIGIQKVRTGLFAYQVEAQTGYHIISKTFNEQEKCGLRELEPFQLPITAIAVQKNFSYTELFRQRLRWQREVGLLQREGQRWMPQKPRCENKVAGFVSIGLTECRYALLMFAIGVCISLGILALEFLYKKFQMRH